MIKKLKPKSLKRDEQFCFIRFVFVLMDHDLIDPVQVHSSDGDDHCFCGQKDCLDCKED